VAPERFGHPRLISFNERLAEELEIDFHGASPSELAQVFSGQKLLEGSEPIAQAYAGFQFGHPVAQLGDGRAHLLGEVNGLDIQLKGSGRTKFSRRGDGRSALGPVLREYIVSEAMHALGVPTTRALCAVATGEEVFRQDGPEPGGILTRVASGHLRVGTFQYFAFQNDIESIKRLLDYTLNRHYPELSEIVDNKQKVMAFLKAFTEKQSDLIAAWSGVGFIHGVMNTDNFSLAGITIDYGPCAFMDEFKWQKTFSSIDDQGRYSYANQVPIAKWNILRLADCLLPLINEDMNTAARIVEEELAQPFCRFEEKRMRKFGQKLGIENYTHSDDALVTDFLSYLEANQLDFTLSFRHLPRLFRGDATFYFQSKQLDQFVKQWKKRVHSIDHLDHINPLYIPRNHQVQKVIDKAYCGDFLHLQKMLEACTCPFTLNTKFEEFSHSPLPEERVYQTFCGT
jgi:uncharacterized protein YdiU (UPF0061 family)